MLIDVCIPVHDPQNLQNKYLIDLLRSISAQSYPPRNVILTSNHEISCLPELLRTFSTAFAIAAFQNNSQGISENLNDAVSRSSNSIVKILFQDDFLIDDDCFFDIMTSYVEEKWHWFCAPSLNYSQTEERFIQATMPEVSKDLINGRNSIGSPSVIAFNRESWLAADPNLSWMLDCDLYLRLWEKYGKPTVGKRFSVASRIHNLQATNWAQVRHDLELNYMREKYSL